jgi:hypothetical protein
MNQTNDTGIEHRKIGLLYWFLSCFFGSVLVGEIERQVINHMQVFHISLFMDGIYLYLILTVISLAISFPMVVIVYYLSKKKSASDFNKLVTTSLATFYLLTICLNYFMSNSLWEAFYLTSPYFLIAFSFKLRYLRILRAPAKA